MVDIIAKTREDYNRIAPYFSGTRYDVWPEFLSFKKFIKTGDRILDFGCGNGRLLLMLKDYKIKYFGVDQSVELLKIARKKFAPQVKSGQAKFFSNASRPKIFPKNYFDLVFCIAMLFHLPNEKTRLAQLKEFYGEMKPGAKAIIMVWNLGTQWARKKSKDWKKIGPNDFLIPWKTPQGETIAERYYHHFTEEELKNLLKQAGFKNIKIKYGHGSSSDSKSARNLVAVAEKVYIKSKSSQ